MNEHDLPLTHTCDRYLSLNSFVRIAMESYTHAHDVVCINKIYGREQVSVFFCVYSIRTCYLLGKPLEVS